MTLKITHGGREVSINELTEILKREAIDACMNELEQRARGAASSITDPETGKHADVFVRRVGDEGMVLSTNGSELFARELERRLGVDLGSIQTAVDRSQSEPLVYLAHASEDKASLARPLADRLMANGIDVWYDQWEIRSGDSLRRKMEVGLSKCTHFLVVLTPVSIRKPWVQAEIDAGFISMVGGGSHFVGVRSGVKVAELSPFLQTLHCPEITLDDDSVGRLIADILGASRKPQLGPKPKYVTTTPTGLNNWSASAKSVAEYLVQKSKAGHEMDPQADVETIARETNLPEEDVRLGILDLHEAGLTGQTAGYDGPMWVWPKSGLFVEFDKHFLGLNSKGDAVAIANWLVSEKLDSVGAEDIAANFPEWTHRRLNSALNYLSEAKIVRAHSALGTGWAFFAISVTDRTLRFVRDNS
jgi:hypothetical protein